MNLLNFNESNDWKFAIWYATFVESILCLNQKYTEELFAITLKKWCKIWGETDFCFEKWHEKFGEFWLKELQRSYVSLHWRMRQYLKKKWLLVWKMTKGNLLFMRAVPSLIFCTLIGWFCRKHIKSLIKKYRRLTSHDI